MTLQNSKPNLHLLPYEEKNMTPVGIFTKKRCTKCFKCLRVHLVCFKCDAVYHAKCLLKVPRFQVDQRGHAFCCRNVISESNPVKEILALQEKPMIVKRKEEYHSDKDLENCLHKEEDLEGNEYKCDSCSLTFTNRVHLENHYSECPDKQGGLLQELYKDKADLVCSFCKEENFQEKSYEQHITQCEEYYSRLNKVNNVEYKCGECKYSTYIIEDLLEHTHIHTIERPFKCDECDYASIEESALNAHILVEHSNAEKKYKCSDCEYSAYKKQYLVKHLHIHANDRPFKCDACDYAAVSKQVLKFHVLTKHSNVEKEHKCSYCKYSTDRKGDLVKHIVTHTNEKPFRCDKCDFATARRTSLKAHIVARHSNAEKKYQCNDCKYSCHQKWNLIEHMRIHTKEKPVKCDTCNYSTIQRANLNSHILTKHSNAEKAYKCNLCKYSTHLKLSLVYHMRTHTNERPFKCDSCNFTTTRRAFLNSHVLAKHSNAEKEHKCSNCKYSTHKKGNLLKHMQIHTAFKCDTCDYTAVSKKVLEAHIVKNHPNLEKDISAEIVRKTI